MAVLYAFAAVSAVISTVLAVPAMSSLLPPTQHHPSSRSPSDRTQTNLTHATTAHNAVEPSTYCTALLYSMFFYEVQKAGRRADSVSGIDVPWRGDSVLSMDGALAGGFFDAGDTVQYSLPEGFSMTMLAMGVLEFPDGYARAKGAMRGVVGHLKHFADYVLQAWDGQTLVGVLGDPNLDHSHWVPPEMIDPMKMDRPVYRLSKDKPGTEVACELAAALAAASMVFDKYGAEVKGAIDAKYVQTVAKTAVELYSFGEQFKGNYSKSLPVVTPFYNSFSGYVDELAWGAGWLAKATKDPKYKAKLFEYYRQSAPTAGWGISWDSKAYGNSFLVYDLSAPGSDERRTAQTNIEADLNYWMNSVKKLYGVLPILDKWGSNRYAANEAFLSALWYKRSNAPEYKTFAKDIIDFLLGKNDDGFSFVIGIGSKYPQNPHHRSAHGSFADDIKIPKETRHTLYGALVGGHEDTSGQKYRDDRDDYITNEVACDYNAGFSGALAALAHFEKSGPPKPIPVEPVGDEVEVQVEQKGSEITVDLLQITAWPPRKIPLTVRYYMPMDKVDAKNVDVSMVEGTRSPKVSKTLMEHNGKHCVEIDWAADDAPFPATSKDNRAWVKFKIGGGTSSFSFDADSMKKSSTTVRVFSGDSELKGKMNGVGNAPPTNPPPPSSPPKTPAPPPKPTQKPPTQTPRKEPQPTAAPTKKPPSPTKAPPKPPSPTKAPPKPPSPTKTPNPSTPTQPTLLDWHVSSSWNGGMVVSASVKGGSAGTGVSFEWSRDAEIVQTWNAVLKSSTKQKVVLETQYGGAFGFLVTFQGNERPKPLKVKIEGPKAGRQPMRPLPPPVDPPGLPMDPQSACKGVSFVLSSSWPNGYVAKISLGQSGNRAGTRFEVSLGQAAMVERLWGFVMVSYSDGHLVGRTKHSQADIGVLVKGSGSKPASIMVDGQMCTL